MKKLGFLSFGHWSQAPGSRVRTARESLTQSVELAVAAESIGIDGAYFRIHHFANQQASPFPLLGAIAARTSRLELGTGVIDMRYENPLYLAEEAAMTDLLSGGRLQLGISRGSPGNVAEGYRYFGYAPGDAGDGEMARSHTGYFLAAIRGAGLAPAGRGQFGERHRVPISPLSAELPERIWWGAGNRQTAEWAAASGMQLMSSTLIHDDKGVPFDQLQRDQIDGFRAAWQTAGWAWPSQVSVSRSIIPLIDDESRAYFAGDDGEETIGTLGGVTTVFGPSLVGTPEKLIDRLQGDAAVSAADMVLVTTPNLLGVDFNVRQLEAIRAIALELGWAEPRSAAA